MTARPSVRPTRAAKVTLVGVLAAAGWLLVLGVYCAVVYAGKAILRLFGGRRG